MKIPVIFLMSLMLASCANGPKRTSDFCLNLDPSVKFSRCETTEAVCYSVDGSGQCWAKPQPSASPAPIRNPSAMKSESQK